MPKTSRRYNPINTNCVIVSVCCVLLSRSQCSNFEFGTEKVHTHTHFVIILSHKQEFSDIFQAQARKISLEWDLAFDGLGFAWIVLTLIEIWIEIESLVNTAHRDVSNGCEESRREKSWKTLYEKKTNRGHEQFLSSISMKPSRFPFKLELIWHFPPLSFTALKRECFLWCPMIYANEVESGELIRIIDLTSVGCFFFLLLFYSISPTQKFSWIFKPVIRTH